MEQQHKHAGIKLGAFGGAVLISIHLLGGETQSARRSVAQQSSDRAPALAVIPTGAEYRIGPGDVVEVRVDKAPELSGTYRVTSDGTFKMYFLGSIVAQDKSAEELTEIIAGGIRGRYLRSPHVTVEVKQYNSHAVFVQGAVRIPGVYQLDGRTSLLKLISMCGGLADNHGSSAFIFHELRSNTAAVPAHVNGPVSQHAEASEARGTDAEYVFMPVNISGLMRGNLSENVMIEPHDIVNIPAADVFFVAGEVRAPGSFPLKPGTTLRQAISLAQGTTIQAAKSRATIFREDASTGRRVDLKVDVGAVMEGKSEDFPIMANDVIIVPSSKLKSVGATLLRSLGLSATQGLYRY